MPRHAPISSETSSVSGTACPFGTQVSCAAVQCRTTDGRQRTETRCTILRITRRRLRRRSRRAVAVRDDPRKAHRISLPAGALLGIAGIDAGELTRTRTSPGPRSGVGNSPTCSTSAALPCRSYQAANMSATSAKRRSTASTNIHSMETYHPPRCSARAPADRTIAARPASGARTRLVGAGVGNAQLNDVE